MIELTSVLHQTSENPELAPQDLQKIQTSVNQVLHQKPPAFVSILKDESVYYHYKTEGDRLAGEFSTCVVIGIGGSALGIQAFYEAFHRSDQKQRLLFCDNVDPVAFDHLLHEISDWSRTCFIVISKSGKTIETLMGAELILEELEKRGLSISRHFLVITEKQNQPLFNWAQQNQIETFEIPVPLGGRYSVLGAVGLVPLAFLGWNPLEIRRGALRALQSEHLIIQVCEAILKSWNQQKWITVLWSYSSQLRYFNLWWQQLWSESLAKKVDQSGKPARRVSSALPAVGACDQHSMLQQFIEGANDQFFVFQRIKTLESPQRSISRPRIMESYFQNKGFSHLLAAEAQATAEALHKEGRLSVTLNWENLSLESFGFAIVFWEAVVASLGLTLDLNPFDQPGVELGKRLALEKLKS